MSADCDELIACFEDRFSKLYNLLSPETVRNHDKALRKFEEYHNETGSCDLLGFTSWLIDRGYEKSTAAIYTSIIKGYMRRCGVEPVEVRLPDPGPPMKRWVILSEEEVARLWSCLAARDRKLYLMYRTGFELALRAGELAALKAGDFDSENCCVRVEAEKRGEYQCQPITEELCRELREWVREQGLSSEDPLFPSSRGGHYNPVVVSRKFSALAEECLGRRLRYHDYARHTAATLLLARSRNLYAAQKRLRHRRIDTTMRYLHLLPLEIRDEILAGIPSLERNTTSETSADNTDNR